MKRILLAAILLSTQALAQHPPSYTEIDWSPLFRGLPLSAIPWHDITVLNHVNTEINSANNGTLNYYCFGTANCAFSTMSADASAAISTGHANGVQVIMTVATGSGSWPSATNPTNLANFVNNVKNVVNLGYDGVVFDWESGAYNQSQINALGDAMKAAIPGKLVMFTVISDFSDDRIIGGAASHYDRFLVMTYDICQVGGGINFSWFNSPLFNDPPGWPSITDGASVGGCGSVDFALKDLSSNGVPASKLAIGLALYGHSQTGPNGPRQNVAISNIGGPEYYEIVAQYPSLVANPHRDSVAQVPWIQTGSNSWITYDDAISLAAKVQYAKAHGYGVFMWSAEADYINGQHPLIDAVAQAWGSSGGTTGGTPTPPTISTGSLSNGSVGTAYQ